MSIKLLYLLFVLLPNLSEASLFMTGISASSAILICFIIGFGKLDNDISDKTRLFLWNKALWMLGLFFVFGTISTFVPNQKQIYTIAGAYTVTNNKEMQKLPDNLLHAANSYLETLSRVLEDKKPAEKPK